MSKSPLADLGSAAPSNDLSQPEKALWWLKKGDLSLGPEWEKAHEICQDGEGEQALDWIHALCHLIEGDLGNAGYWFRRAGKPADSNEPERVWEEIAREVQAS